MNRQQQSAAQALYNDLMHLARMIDKDQLTKDAIVIRLEAYAKDALAIPKAK